MNTPAMCCSRSLAGSAPGSDATVNATFQKPELRITGVDGRRTVLVVSVESREFTLGRSRSNRVRIDDPCVSGKHLRFVVESSDVLVEDLGSTHGTHLNGKLLEKGSPTPLRDSDELRCGGTSIRYVCYSDRIRNVFAEFAGVDRADTPTPEVPASSLEPVEILLANPATDEPASSPPMAGRHGCLPGWFWPTVIASYAAILLLFLVYAVVFRNSLIPRA